MDTSKAAAALGRRGGKAGTGEAKRRGDADHYRAIRAKRRYYGIVALPAGSRLCADERQTVVAFRSVADRARWLALGEPSEDRPTPHRYLRTFGEQRREATRDEALACLREIMPGADASTLAVMAPWPTSADELD